MYKKANFLIFLITICWAINLKAGVELLDCSQLGFTCSPRSISKLSGKSKINAEKSLNAAKNIVKEITEIVKTYNQLSVEQKLQILALANKGISNSISGTKIGSGNIIVFSLLCDLRQCLLTDLIKVYNKNENDKVKYAIESFVKQSSKSINIEQIKNLLLNEFDIKTPSNMKNTIKLLFNIIDPKYPVTKGRPIFDEFMLLSMLNSKLLMRSALHELDKPKAKTVLLFYVTSEITNCLLKCGLKLKVTPLSTKKFAGRYLFFRPTMNQLQKELFHFTETKYDKKSNVKFYILTLQSYARRVSKADSHNMIIYLKMRTGIKVDFKIGHKQ